MKRSADRITPVPKRGHKAQKKRFAARRDPAYLDWIGQQTCVLLGHRSAEPMRLRQFLTFPIHACETPVQACHVRSRGVGGMDRGNLVPMCGWLHDEQHTFGMKSFQRRWSINLAVEAQQLYQQYLAEGGRA